MSIKFDTPVACRSELETCSDGLASLIAEFEQLRASQAVVDEQWEIIESIGWQEVKPKGGETAAAIKARVVDWILDKPELALIRAATFDLKAQMDIVERQFRNYEKRMSAAQSALKDHDAEARGAGFGQQSQPQRGGY